MSLEQLGNIQITSVSRTPERLADAAGSVFVITAEAIRRSGATTLPEALRLAPNLLVARIDSHQYAISARGFNSSTANKLQVLIDGRIVYTPLYSGVFWDAQLVPLDEVERIEVISGPASTLWGANAVNGVINVITRPAAQSAGKLLAADYGSFERGVFARHGGPLGAHGSYRIYAGGQDFARSERSDGSAAEDGWRGRVAGFRFDQASRSTTTTLQGDSYQNSIEQAGSGRQFNRGANLLGRWERDLGDQGSLRLQAYWDHTTRDVPGLFGERLDVADVDIQHTMAMSDGSRTLWGGGYRWADDRVDTLGPGLAFLPANRRMHWASAFVQHERSPVRDWRLTLGARAEHNNFTGLELMPNARLAWKPAPEHLLWTAWSRSVRVPSRIDNDLFVPAQPPFLLAGGRDFKSEIATTVELGYRGQLGDAATATLTLFGSRYDRLRSLDPGQDGELVLGNRTNGRAVGLEGWGSWRISAQWRLSAGFLALRQQFDSDGQATLPPGNDPPVQWHLTSGWEWGESGDLDLVLRHVAALPDPAVPSYTAVDLRYGRRLSRAVSLALAATNLFEPAHEEFASSGRLPVQVRREARLTLRVSF